MKHEVDSLMAEAELDALLIVGSTAHNPAMTYFTGRVSLTGDLVKKRGEAPLLFHHAMERDEAARTGLKLRQIDRELNWLGLLKESGGDDLEALTLYYQRVLQAAEASGRVALYGQVEVGLYVELIRRLESSALGLEIVGESPHTSLLSKARRTKDEVEIEHIREMGRVTVEVVGRIADFLTSHRIKNGVLVNGQGDVLTIGRVKRQIDLRLAEHGAENLLGTTFAIGRDAGVPHSVGPDEDPVEAGKAIVFDIFPSQAGGGYFHDFTRTWCLGPAPDELLQLHEDVAEVYQRVLEAMEANALCRDSQLLACRLFEEKGHPTVMSDPETLEGYVHGLGHGIGLAIHEAPSFIHMEENDDRLLPGTVFTLEPGLYYPDRGMGVRLEDTLLVQSNGQVQPLVSFPMDLVLEAG